MSAQAQQYKSHLQRERERDRDRDRDRDTHTHTHTHTHIIYQINKSSLVKKKLLVFNDFIMVR